MRGQLRGQWLTGPSGHQVTKPGLLTTFLSTVLKNMEVRTYFTLYPGDSKTDAPDLTLTRAARKARVRLPCLMWFCGVRTPGRRYGQAAGLRYQWEIMHVCLSTGTECVWQREAKVTLFSYC